METYSTPLSCSICRSNAVALIKAHTASYPRLEMRLVFTSPRCIQGMLSRALDSSGGKWWDDDAVDERFWVFLSVWPEENECRMGVLDPNSLSPPQLQGSRKSA